MEHPQRISSNWTLFLKLFLPTFWFVFYGAVVIAIFASQTSGGSTMASSGLQWAALVFYVSGSVVLYYTLMPLKRVEFDEHFLYVSNYFKTVRIPWHNVEELAAKKRWVVLLGKVVFKEPVTFGKRVQFVASSSLFKEYLKSPHHQMRD